MFTYDGIAGGDRTQRMRCLALGVSKQNSIASSSIIVFVRVFLVFVDDLKTTLPEHVEQERA
jgi:hypothetical protein